MLLHSELHLPSASRAAPREGPCASGREALGCPLVVLVDSLLLLRRLRLVLRHPAVQLPYRVSLVASCSRTWLERLCMTMMMSSLLGS